MTVAVLQSQTAAESICTLGQGQTSISLVMDDCEWEGRKGRLTHLKEDTLSCGLAVNTVHNSEKDPYLCRNAETVLLNSSELYKAVISTTCFNRVQVVYRP